MNFINEEVIIKANDGYVKLDYIEFRHSSFIISLLEDIGNKDPIDMRKENFNLEDVPDVTVKHLNAVFRRNLRDMEEYDLYFMREIAILCDYLGMQEKMEDICDVVAIALKDKGAEYITKYFEGMDVSDIVDKIE